MFFKVCICVQYLYMYVLLKTWEMTRCKHLRPSVSCPGPRVNPWEERADDPCLCPLDQLTFICFINLFQGVSYPHSPLRSGFVFSPLGCYLICCRLSRAALVDIWPAIKEGNTFYWGYIPSRSSLGKEAEWPRGTRDKELVVGGYWWGPRLWPIWARRPGNSERSAKKYR